LTVIQPVQAAAQQAALSLQKAFDSGLTDALDSIIERTKSASQAFRDFGKSLLDNVIHSADSRLANLVTGGLSGNTPGGGIFGLIGNAAVGNVGGVGQSLFGGASIGGGGGGSGAGAGSAASGSLLGGIGRLLFGGGAAASTAAADAASGITFSADEIAAAQAGEVGSTWGAFAAGQTATAGASSGGLLAGLLSLFDTGGYTGDGRPGDPAGIVHRGEYVLNAGQVKALGGPGSIDSIIGSYVRSPAIPAVGRAFAPAPGRGSASGVSAGTVVLPAMPISEDLLTQINNHPSSARLVADLMLRNPSSFGPAVKSLSK
jgi:hypothetical protein